MSDDRPRARRPSLRLPHYDYALPGGYFVTICTHHRACFFGQVLNGSLALAPGGQMVQDAWEELPERFPHLALGAFIVMPNHVHGILLLQDEVFGVSLGQIVGAFKSITTHRYILGVKRSGWPRFDGRLWQDNYFEHVIRNEEAMDRIREYIVSNPASWETDPERLPG